jgi:hypothetical protein
MQPMIEFTVLLDDSPVEFEPSTSEPELALLLPPTARIGRDDDVVHLAPIPVHCLFNAMTFGHWLAGEHSLSENDAFVVYAIHDMFKALLCLASRKDGGRNWLHRYERFFDEIQPALAGATVFEDFSTSFRVASRHGEFKRIGRKRTTLVPWREAVAHERDSLAGVEERGDRWEWDWPMIGLTIRLQSALSNALSIAYIKKLFVESYVDAMRAEYPDVFGHFDAVSYQYRFVDPATLTGDVDSDIEALCRQSEIYLDGRRLVIRTFVGAYGAHWRPAQQTVIRLPFWLLLTLHEDPISILFPAPTLYGRDGNHADNPAFVDRVRDGFQQRVRNLLSSARATQTKRMAWVARVEQILAAIDDTFHVTHTTAFDEATSARRVDTTLATETCSMCGSPVPESFICSPVTDLGANVSNYTDWHLGDADQACALCAISHFKTPEALEPARKLIFQRKAVYLATSTPSAEKSGECPANLPFFTATGFKPRLDIRSLESLVTLNIVAALYLHDTLRQSVHYRNGEPDLWLHEGFPTQPFSFAGEVAKAKNKVEMPMFLAELFERLNRRVTVLDPLVPMQVEIPIHTLACLWGVSKGRHYQFKYKPLIVSNETATLPVIWEGYHFIDRQTLESIETLRLFLETFRHPKVSHRMKLTALASDPEEFIDTLIQRGGFSYETVLRRLAQLSGELDAQDYLIHLRELIVQTPLITEMWE